ncbi:hypothetical protein B0H14DRAFT_3481192 [Mycena olivaceomarginata]|nr:hypothetical protein B0H14DRAFT_3481192 [Mycena olivaceomarginata]
MIVLQGGNDSVFKDPDMYLLSLHIYAPKYGPSPFIRLDSFMGAKDDGDAPPWTSILKPEQIHYFLETTAFAATVMRGMTDIKVESVSSVRSYTPAIKLPFNNTVTIPVAEYIISNVRLDTFCLSWYMG